MNKLIGDKKKSGTDSLTVSSASGGRGVRLKKRERNALKTLFNSVNAELSNALSKHYVIPDPVLRNDVCSTMIDFVVPLYLDFWRKYSDVNFSEHKSKYFKIEPSLLEEKLKSLFDASI